MSRLADVFFDKAASLAVAAATMSVALSQQCFVAKNQELADATWTRRRSCPTATPAVWIRHRQASSASWVPVAFAHYFGIPYQLHAVEPITAHELAAASMCPGEETGAATVADPQAARRPFFVVARFGFGAVAFCVGVACNSTVPVL